MLSVSISKLKTDFSRILQRVASGQEILITKRGTPIAKLVPIPGFQKRSRKLGVDKGRVQIADNFDAPLPPEILAGFLGNPPKPKKRKAP
jgi:prevent-host-death family protein